MKVVYLHQYFTTAKMVGGTRSYEFARRLVRDGHEVHVVTSDRSGDSRTKGWSVSEVEGIKVHSVPQAYNNAMNPGQRLVAFFRFAVLASARARALAGDVVFATSTPLTIAIPGIAATVGKRTPLVMEIRDLWPDVPIALGYLRNPVMRFFAKALERAAYRNSAAIVALSKDMEAGIIAKGVNQSRITVIQNLSDTSRFQEKYLRPADFYESHRELQGRPFVVYAGAFGYVNGLEYMVSLASHYREYDSRMAFVAIGEGGRRAAVEEFAERLGVLGKNFFIFDPVPKDELPTVLAAATACSSWVMPINELAANSANKFFDALAAGRPMLINHGGWQSETLMASGAGIALDQTNLANAARSLYERLSDDEWLSQARSASLHLGITQFETELLYSKFHSVLQSARNAERVMPVP